MMETKWTPGPYVALGRCVIDRNDNIITVSDGTATSVQQDLVNARLFAAAPDLYAALKLMVDRWEPDTSGKDRDMWETARAALAAAVGGVKC